MDATSIILSIIPLMLAIVFSAFSAKGLEELIMEKVQSVLTPVWCLITFLCWTFFGIISIYAATLDYLANLSWLYIGIGIIFFILFWVALFLVIKISADMHNVNRDADEMRLQ